MAASEEPESASVEDVHANGVEKPEGEVEETTPETAPAARGKKVFVKKYPKPDDSQLKRECEALSAQIEQHKAKIEDIKQLIGTKSESRRSGSGAQQQVRNKLNDLRQQFQAELVRALWWRSFKCEFRDQVIVRKPYLWLSCCESIMKC